MLRVPLLNNNFLCASAALRFCVKIQREDAETRGRKESQENACYFPVRSRKACSSFNAMAQRREDAKKVKKGTLIVVYATFVLKSRHALC